MNPHRPRRNAAQLRESYSETVDALRRNFEQLEVAVAQFNPDLDERALTAAWNSDDPVERNRVALLLGCFEKNYMLLMDMVALSVKLARIEASTEDENAPPIAVLRESGVISGDVEAAIENQRKVRNTSQHIYVELVMSALRSAVLGQLGTTPGAIQSIAGWVELLEQTPEAHT